MFVLVLLRVLMIVNMIGSTLVTRMLIYYKIGRKETVALMHTHCNSIVLVVLF